MNTSSEANYDGIEELHAGRAKSEIALFGFLTGSGD